MGPCEGALQLLTPGWLVSVARCEFLLGDCESGIGGSRRGGRAGGAVREFARSSRAVGATRRGTEGALSHISEEEEQENDGTEES